MKQTELRIGNLLQDREGRICRVEQLSIDEDYFEAPAIKDSITSLPNKPILINESNLINCGFEEIEDGWYSIDNNNIVINWNIYDKRVRAMGNTIYKTKHLHQLQNLYFALTGKELKIDVNSLTNK